MGESGLNFLYIALGILLLVLLLANRYWGTFAILLAQPLFVTSFSEGAGFSAAKMVYGALFTVWFGAWALSKLFGRKTEKSSLTPSMAAPALAFGALLGLAIVIGLLYGAPLGNIIRDLSQYVGYLAVLPLLDLVRTSTQAKRLILFLALIGLPASIMTDAFSIALKQDEELSHAFLTLVYAAPYWGPIQGAVWAAAVSFPGFAVKLLAWAWLVFKGALSVFSGFRYMLLMFVIGGLTAFLVSGRITRHSLARYMIPLFLMLMMAGVLADVSGMIKLPISDITRERYGTLLSGKKLQQDQSMEGRFIESRALLHAFLRNPVTGLGLGQSLHYRDVTGYLDKSRLRFKYHNGYLETLMKFGVVGTAIFAWYFFTLIRQAFAVVRTSDHYFAKVMGLGVVIWLVPALAASLAGSAFSDRGFSLTVGVMAGLLPALVSEGTDSK
jgi:O-antigen ligase